MQKTKIILMLFTSSRRAFHAWANEVFGSQNAECLSRVDLTVATHYFVQDELVSATADLPTVTPAALDIHSEVVEWASAPRASEVAEAGITTVVVNSQRWWESFPMPDNERILAKMSRAMRRGFDLIICSSGKNGIGHNAYKDELDPLLALLDVAQGDRYSLVCQRPLYRAAGVPYGGEVEDDLRRFRIATEGLETQQTPPAMYFAPAHIRTGDEFDADALCRMSTENLDGFGLSLDLNLKHPEQDAASTLELIRRLGS